MKKRAKKCRISRLVAVLLSTTLAFSGVPEHVRAERDSSDHVISISTGEELIELAGLCHIDEWSRGKTIKLEKDLNLSGMEYELIPIFAGTFDGQGHTIRGISYGADGYVAGFFRHIEKDGVVENLNLEIVIADTNEQLCIGGICGENSGVIKNCTFSGALSGRVETGGIAGRNTATGQIQNCVSDGMLTGYYYTGGIVGKNHGIVTGCVNRSAINTSADWAKEDDANSFDWLQTFRNREETASVRSGVDTGGIAGYSDGVLMSCENAGNVGYEHVGYNIGGIAGRQSGLISLCSNMGRVQGRKDVGGIVGQMEPYIKVEPSNSIEGAIQELHDLIEVALLDLDDGNAAVDEDFKTLKEHSDSALAKANLMADQISEFVDDNVESVNQISERISYVLEALPSVQKYIEAATAAMSDVTKDLSKINEDLDVINEMKNTPYNWQGYDRLTLQAGIGGTIATDNASPATGTRVTITYAPQKGYALESLTVRDANGMTVPVSASGDKYSFTMPGANVLVQAQYRYVGTYVPASNSGGKLTCRETDAGLEITAAPDTAYQWTALTIDGKTVAVDSASNKVTVNKADYPLNGRPVIVRGTFSAENPGTSAGASFPPAGGKYRITTLSANGGRAASSVSTCEAGGSVQLFLTEESGYRFKSLTVSADDGGQPLECTEVEHGVSYRFVMPASNVTIAAEFEPVLFVMTSNVGGSGDYTVDGDRITIQIRPLDGYSVSGMPMVTDADGKAVSVSRTRTDAYVYECSVSAAKQPVSAKITFGGQTEYDALQTAVKTMDGCSAELTAAMGSCKVLVDEISGIALDANGNPVGWTNISEANRNLLIKDIVELAKQLSLAGDAAARFASSISVISNLVNAYAVDTLESVHEDFGTLTDDLQRVIDGLSEAERQVDGILDYLNAQEDIKFTELGEDYYENLDGLYIDLQNIFDSMSSIEKDLSGSIQQLSDDCKAINDQLNIVLLLFVDRIDRIQNPDRANYYQDVSDEELAGKSDGRVSSCVNSGTVLGDINIGGIAGAMSIDEEDPEDSAAGKSHLSVGGIYRTRCVLTDSRNYGYITAKKDGCGGIAGYMSLGVVTDCEAYGGAYSTEGGYVGGICGQSMGIIRRCYALVTLEGISYVGGIAGYADAVYNCYSMTTVARGDNRIGAIVGQLGDTEEDGSRNVASCAKNNYYVGDDLYGIDNISYVGIAEPMTYKKLLQTEGLPGEFRHLTVYYVIDDVCVSTEEVPFGAALEDLNFPKIPDRDGQNGVWPDLAGKTMSGNLRLVAIYEDDISVLKSAQGEDFSGADGLFWRPYAMAEGVYTGRAKLTAELSEKTLPATVSGGKECRVYDIMLTDADIPADKEVTVRLLNPYGKNAEVLVQRNGKWRRTDAKVRGGYLQVSMVGSEAAYALLPGGMSLRTKLLIGAGILVALVLVIVFFRKIRLSLTALICAKKQGKKREKTKKGKSRRAK